MPRSRLATYLRTERLRCGLTQRELGELLGLSGSAIGKVERGHRTPSLRLVLSAEIVFGRASREIFPDLYEDFETAILFRAVALDLQLAEQAHGKVERKRGYLSALINRLQFHHPSL